MKCLRVRLLLALCLVVVCPTALWARYVGSGATPTPDHVILTLTNDPATTMTVSWRAATSVTAGLVEYAAGSTLTAAHSVPAQGSVFTTDLGPSRLYTTTLTGLAPHTQYTYRVGDGQHWSATHSFSTADPAARRLSFLVFGDSQSSATGSAPYGAWRATLHNAYRANPDARFMVSVGDLVDIGQSGAHWNAWLAAGSGVIDRLPVFATVGNHETFSPSHDPRPSYWNAQLRMPQNGPNRLRNQAYSYDYGPVHLVVLDSQGREQEKFGDLLDWQRTWLEADLAASHATWKIAFFHKAPYSVKAKRTSPEVKAAFCPTLERHHVDLVFNGHDHGLGRTYPMRDGKALRKPSQGTVYYVAGRSGSKTYDDLERKSWTPFFYDPQDQPNYLVVEVEATRLTVRAMKQDGSLIDTFFLDKATDIDSDTGLGDAGPR